MSSRRPPTAASGSPPPITFPKHHRSGCTPTAAVAPPRPRRKPVITSSKIEERARPVAGGAQPLEEPGLGGDEPHVRGHRLDDHAGHGFVDLRDLVVGRDDRRRDGTRRHAGGAGKPERRDAAPAAGEQRVGVAVVAAGELDDAVAPGGAAGEPDDRHRGLGAGRDEPHLLDPPTARVMTSARRHLALGRGAEGRAACRGGADRLEHGGVGMPEDGRSPGLDVVEHSRRPSTSST